MAAEQHSYQEHSEEQRQGLLDTLNRQGYVVIPDCIDPALLTPVNARVDELYAQQEDLYAEMAKTLSSEQAEQAAQALKNQAFILNLAGCGEEFTSLLTQPNLLNMVTTIMGEDALLSSASMRDVFGGCEEQLIHTDDSLYAGRDDLFKRPIAKQLSLVATVALGDQLANRGATVIFPESHLWEEAPDVVEQAEMTSESAAYNERMRNWAKKHKKTEAIEVEMKAGSVVIWLGATWHAGGAYRDTEGEPRRAA